MIKKLTKSPTHASTKRKITDELKHNAGWYEVREGSPVEVQWENRVRIRSRSLEMASFDRLRTSLNT